MQNVEMQETLQCPYEPSHQILKSRMQVHLGRCRRNHLNSPKVTCPFNVTHIFNKQELKWHVTVCPERRLYEHFCHSDGVQQATGSTKPPQNMTFHTLECAENWDDEPDAPTYNPEEYVKNAPVLRSIQGAAPAERRKFREQERHRLLNLKKTNSEIKKK